MNIEEETCGYTGKLNCWEFMKCERVVDGNRSIALGICPVAHNLKFDGVHGGIGAGRACWVIPETLCGDEVQGTFAHKFLKCSQCRFYAHIRSEEGQNLIPTSTLLKMLA